MPDRDVLFCRTKENQKGRRCPEGMKAPVGLLSRRPVCEANAACSARQGRSDFDALDPTGCGGSSPQGSGGALSVCSRWSQPPLPKREARSAPITPLAPFQKRGRKRSLHGLGSPFGRAGAKRLRGFISSPARCSRREPAPADAVCHCGPSREKAKEKSPQAFLLCKSKIIFPLSLSERSGDNSNRPFTPVLPLRSCRTPGTAQSPPRTAPPACQCPHWRCRSAGCPR